MDEPTDGVVLSPPADLQPLTSEETTRLTECEANIEKGLADFVRVGLALMQIAVQTLYRGNYTTFEDYCRQRWGLARRSAYQKMQAAEAYENVRNYAQFPPQNEFQALQLHALPTAKLQRTAWKQVVETQGNEPHAITAQKIRKVVTTLQPPPKRGKTLASQLVADRTFPGIPWHWPIAKLTLDPETHTQKRSLLSLPLATPQEDITPNRISDTQLILVSPDIDIFTWILSSEYLDRLLVLLKSVPYRRFLFWTSQPARFPALSWPSNVELMVRISRQCDIERMTDRPKDAALIQALWLRPQEALSLPSPLSFTRVLIGDAIWAEKQTPANLTSARQVVGKILCDTPIVHLATAMQPTLLGYQ